MHTEEQAKALWCPHGRIALEVTGATINDPSLLGGAQGADYACACIASRCAMWRWADPASRFSNGERKGCCGLAGKAVA